MKVTRALALLSLPLALAGAAHAQTWVSNTGNDANSCTMASPCRTFKRAVAVTPYFGNIHVLNAGDYGPVVINSPLEIDGGGMGSITVSGSTTAIVVNISTGVAQIRNLAVHGYSGASPGILFQGTGGIDIDNVQVTGIAGNCIQISPQGTVDAVIKDTTVENCSSTGIYIEAASGYPATAKIVNTHVRYANVGLDVPFYSTVSVFHSTFSSPGTPTASSNTIGVEVAGWSNVMLDDCQVSGFGTGVFTQSSGGAQVSRSSIIGNYLGVSSPGGGVLSNGNNSFFANDNNGTFFATYALQ